MKHWTPEDVREWDSLLQEVVESAETTVERTDLMERLMDDAVNAHRPWANDMQRQCLRDGYARQWKAYMKRTRVIVATREATVEKPRVVGVKRLDEAGAKYDVQALYELLTFDEIRAKRRENLAQIKAYTDSVAVCDKYLALQSLAPEAATPAEAAKSLGIDIDEWLAGHAA